MLQQFMNLLAPAHKRVHGQLFTRLHAVVNNHLFTAKSESEVPRIKLTTLNIDMVKFGPGTIGLNSTSGLFCSDLNGGMYGTNVRSWGDKVVISKIVNGQRSRTTQKLNFFQTNMKLEVYITYNFL